MKKYAFIDRDGTVVVEPPDTKQVNGLEQLVLIPYVISSLVTIQQMGYRIVVVSNQDNLGTPKNPTDNYNLINEKMLAILKSEGIVIDQILTCPHTEAQQCSCRKPNIGLVQALLPDVDLQHSFMVGDRQTDVEFAKRLGIQGFLLTDHFGWKDVVASVKQLGGRKGQMRRTTNETDIEVSIYLDGTGRADIHTGLAFFDHMLEQLAKHGQFDVYMKAYKNDLKIDEHHLIEDVAIALGNIFKEALHQKIGIQRYSYEWLLPMDDAIAYVAMDLSGRPYLKYEGRISREYVGDFPTEMLQHFYYSFAMQAGITLHVRLGDGNNHHQVESSFKAFAKCLHLASRIVHDQVSSTKGIL